MKEYEDLKLYGIRNRQKYLNETDWQIIRLYESNISVEQNILDKRTQARQEISLIRDSANYEEVNHISIDF